MSHILVVEDDPLIRHTFRDLLERVGHTVMAVATGHSAIQAVSSGAPQIVLMDVGLPDVDGIALAARLRQLRLTCPLIFLTAHGDADFVSRAITCDPYAYLVKPISGEQLIPIVRTALHAAQAEHAREDKLLTALTDSRQISAAVGMLAERNGCAIEDAFAVLRLMARSEGRRIVDVAIQITSRTR